MAMTLLNEVGLTLGKRIKTARQIRDMRQQDVADAVGVSRQAVASWEAGETEPSASHFIRLARATNQPLDWFAEGLDVRLKGLEPPTFWMGVSRLIVGMIVCQAYIDAEIAAAGSVR